MLALTMERRVFCCLSVGEVPIPQFEDGGEEVDGWEVVAGGMPVVMFVFGERSEVVVAFGLA